jgi:hypothetical protein
MQLGIFLYSILMQIFQKVPRSSATPQLFFCSLYFGVCSFFGSHSEIRLVGTVKRIVVFLRMLEQLSLENHSHVFVLFQEIFQAS